MLDIRPPLAPFLYIFGHPVPFEITAPGRPARLTECFWLPSSRQLDNVGDVAVLDTMRRLAIPLIPEDQGTLPVGTRCVGPALGDTVPRVWTVRQVFYIDDEWADVGVAR